MSNSLIIDTPKLQSLRQRFASTFLTLVFWVLWFYLWIPIVTLLGWWLQVEAIQHQMVTLGGYKAFLDALPTFLAITAGFSALLAIWALYNFARFRGLDRRKPSSPVDQKALLQVFNISQDDLITAQTEKVMVVYFDQDEKITITSR